MQETKYDSFEEVKEIVIDSREQLPLFYGRTRKISEGDYTIPELENLLVVERKAPGDLYGSILGGHKRFVNEITRATLQGKKFYIFVECTEQYFYSKQWATSFRSKTSAKTLYAILKKMEEKYGFIIVWCEDRNDMRMKITKLFELYYKLYFSKEIKIKNDDTEF